MLNPQNIPYYQSLVNITKAFRFLLILLFFLISSHLHASYATIDHPLPSKEKYDLLSYAIKNKKQVLLLYDGLRREVCPHTLGEKNGTKRVLVYQFGGQSKSGLPKQGGWRCLFLQNVTILEVRDGAWHTGTSHTRPQTCIDHIEVEVNY